MITYVIKSTICLTVLYGFYHLSLLNRKVFEFNRFYLLFSLLFALIIPLITIRINIPVNFTMPVNPEINGFSNVVGGFVPIQGDAIIAEPVHYLTFQNALLILYIIISGILLVRFILNIYKIRKLIHASPIIIGNPKIVLVEKQTLPYSFLRYIFVNRSDYENELIEKELIIHERTHCTQYHSVDIVLIELVKIFLWFNPILWLFRKAIQLNHEFLADNKVLSNHDLSDYQNTLINLVFRNNSTYLASNFDYSLTKKRLIMMTKHDSLRKAIYIKIAAVPLFLVLAIPLTFSQGQRPVISTDASGIASQPPVAGSAREGVSQALLTEYQNILSTFMTRTEQGNLLRVPGKKFSYGLSHPKNGPAYLYAMDLAALTIPNRERMEAIYKQMSKEQQTQCELLGVSASGMFFQKRVPTQEEFESWRDAKKFNRVTIDNMRMTNEDLNRYKNTDFSSTGYIKADPGDSNIDVPSSIILETNKYYQKRYDQYMSVKGSYTLAIPKDLDLPASK